MIDVSPTRVAKEFYGGYSGPDLAANFDRYVAEDLDNHVGDGTFGRAGWLAWDRQWREGFADLTVEILDQIAEGDKVVTRWRLGGTHTGTFSGIAASGRTAYFTAVSIDRVHDGKIVEHWSELEFGPFLRLLASGESSTFPS